MSPPTRKRKTVDSRPHPPKHHRLGETLTPALADNSAPAWPLTAENLSRVEDPSRLAELDLDYRSNISESMASQPGEYDKLAIAGVLVDNQEPMSPPVRQFINDLFGRARDHPSPRAAYVVANAHAARQGGKELAKELLAKGIGLECFRDGGYALSTRHPNIRLDDSFLPNSPKARQDMRLKPAQPDVANGYLTRREAAGATVPFNRDEEAQIMLEMVRNPRTGQLCPLNVTPRMFFPYYTIQWKSNDAMYKATAQGACDGAVINEHLRSLYSAAQGPNNPNESDVVLTMHFSATFEGNLVILWVHFYNPEKSAYHMERVGQFVVDEQEPMTRYRRFLRNLEDYAMGPRLDAIKRALSDISAGSAPGAEQGAAGDDQAAAPVR
ncbi:hypothetical protein P171DRAFT_179423 [Karstenula rhodostoma CBS 690.94]|uniref:DUF7924 domain-containing protein n=1 Tax=Karstenula rhodostoma CBS 690.94 TaxID=1392251 RepID=A0A9P4U464_9PLEO|nr:hypothetical protein P171DRAFT_179423 [Karstenula rhodostoma CBS 690.94]